MKTLKWILGILGTLILIAGIGLFIFYQSLKPTYSGELNLQGVEKPVEVYFDSYGIPHIYAQTEADAYYALGFVHAQERLFQMDLMRRVGSGRLSEIFGKELVETDKFFRTLGIAQKAEDYAKSFNPDSSHAASMALAYANGINKFIEIGLTPIEYTLLGVEKEKFIPSDFYNIAGYMAYSFASAFRIEPIVSHVFEKYGAEYLPDLGITHVKGTQTIPVNNTTADSQTAWAAKISKINENLPIPLLKGSNSWVLAPSRTKSGKAMLMNDTHIGFAQPAVWYEAHIEFPGHRYYGNFLAGIPFALIGHGDSTAVGITMLENDDVDMIREHVNPADSNQYWANGAWNNFTTRTETIRIKGGDSVEFSVKTGIHGPVVNQVLERIGNSQPPIAVWWTFTQTKSDLLEAFYLMSNAKNIADAEKASSLINAPGLNIMYADAKGNIAWWAAGKLVKRPPNTNTKIYINGADSTNSYNQFFDFSENPHCINPTSGFVYSANNQPETTDSLYYPGYYAPENRAKRIVELLATKEKWSVDEAKLMQTDVISAIHPNIAADLLALISEETKNLSDKHQKAFEALQVWNGDHQIGDIAPTIYYRFLYQVLENAYADEMGIENFKSYESSHEMAIAAPWLIKNDSSPWWDNVATDAKESREQIVNQAFMQTVEALKKQLGTDTEKWTWSRVHFLEHKHSMGAQKPLNLLFNVGSFAVKGGNQVINNIDFKMNAEGVYYSTYGPAVRRIIDFADVEHSYNVLPTGVSGNFASPHYADQAELFNKGEYRLQLLNKEEIINMKKHLLKLQPGK